MGRRSRRTWEQRASREAAEQRRLDALTERRRAVTRGAAEARRRGCLICRHRDRPFTGVEHIVPETLGNDEHVLPSGVVCDPCNLHCSKLDKALAEFPAVRMNKTFARVPSKKGKLPQVAFENGTVRATAADHVELLLDEEISKTPIPGQPGRVNLRFTADLGQWTPKSVSRVHRALVKQALEYSWLTFGEERALSSEFDHERRIILRGGHRGYVAMVREVSEPNVARISVTHDHRRRTADDHPLTLIVASFGGVTLVTDTLFPAPPNPRPDLFLLMQF